MSPEYAIWAGMIERCTNPNIRHWKDYGGRGITVCERWRGEHGFENFIQDVGRRPEGTLPSGRAVYSIDRFPNNDGNYEQGNVRWATPIEQANNRRCSKKAA